MKKLVVLFAVLFSAGVMLAQGGSKIGYVNSQTIFEQYPEAIKVQSDLDAQISAWTNQIDSMKADLQASFEDYKAQREMMTPQNRETTEQQLFMQEQAIQQFQQEKFGQPNGQLYVIQEQRMAPIRKTIREAIDSIAKQEGLNFVFDKTENIPLLLFADDEFDITFQVLDKLKRGNK